MVECRLFTCRFCSFFKKSPLRKLDRPEEEAGENGQVTRVAVCDLPETPVVMGQTWRVVDAMGAALGAR